MDLRRDGKMEAIDEKYWECPNCGWVISFHFKEGKYVSLCPYCKDRLEMDINEFEGEEEIYFKKNF